MNTEITLQDLINTMVHKINYAENEIIIADISARVQADHASFNLAMAEREEQRSEMREMERVYNDRS